MPDPNDCTPDDYGPTVEKAEAVDWREDELKALKVLRDGVAKSDSAAARAAGHLQSQIDRLAEFLMKEFSDHISEEGTGGAVDCAIRLLTYYKKRFHWAFDPPCNGMED